MSRRPSLIAGAFGILLALAAGRPACAAVRIVPGAGAAGIAARAAVAGAAGAARLRTLSPALTVFRPAALAPSAAVSLRPAGPAALAASIALPRAEAAPARSAPATPVAAPGRAAQGRGTAAREIGRLARETGARIREAGSLASATGESAASLGTRLHALLAGETYAGGSEVEFPANPWRETLPNPGRLFARAYKEAAEAAARVGVSEERLEFVSAGASLPLSPSGERWLFTFRAPHERAGALREISIYFKGGMTVAAGQYATERFVHELAGDLSRLAPSVRVPRDAGRLSRVSPETALAALRRAQPGFGARASVAFAPSGSGFVYRFYDEAGNSAELDAADGTVIKITKK